MVNWIIRIKKLTSQSSSTQVIKKQSLERSVSRRLVHSDDSTHDKASVTQPEKSVPILNCDTQGSKRQGGGEGARSMGDIDQLELNANVVRSSHGDADDDCDVMSEKSVQTKEHHCSQLVIRPNNTTNTDLFDPSTSLLKEERATSTNQTGCDEQITECGASNSQLLYCSSLIQTIHLESVILESEFLVNSTLCNTLDYDTVWLTSSLTVKSKYFLLTCSCLPTKNKCDNASALQADHDKSLASETVSSNDVSSSTVVKYENHDRTLSLLDGKSKFSSTDAAEPPRPSFFPICIDYTTSSQQTVSTMGVQLLKTVDSSSTAHDFHSTLFEAFDSPTMVRRSSSEQGNQTRSTEHATLSVNDLSDDVSVSDLELNQLSFDELAIRCRRISSIEPSNDDQEASLLDLLQNWPFQLTLLQSRVSSSLINSFCCKCANVSKYDTTRHSDYENPSKLPTKGPIWSLGCTKLIQPLDLFATARFCHKAYFPPLILVEVSKIGTILSLVAQVDILPTSTIIHSPDKQPCYQRARTSRTSIKKALQSRCIVGSVNLSLDQLKNPCVYLEISRCYDVNGLTLPNKQLNSDSLTIKNYLERRLKSAIYSEFLSNSLNRETKSTKSKSTGRTDVDTKQSLCNYLGLNSAKNTQPVFGLRSALFPSHLTTRQRPIFYRDSHIFTQSNVSTRPPSQWLRHAGNSFDQVSLNRCMLAFKFDTDKNSEDELCIGGLINHSSHLQVVASTAGPNFNQLMNRLKALVNRMVKENSTTLFASPKAPCDSWNIQCHVRLPVLCEFLSCASLDVTHALRLDQFGVKARALSVDELATYGYTCKTLLLESVVTEGVDDLSKLQLVESSIGYLIDLASDLLGPFRNGLNSVGDMESLSFLTTISPPGLVEALRPFETDLAQLSESTSANGGTLAHCLRGSAFSGGSLLPTACDADSFNLFNVLFDPIMSYLTLKNELTCKWYEKPSAIPNVLQYRVKFVRNLNNHPFYPCQSINDFVEIDRQCRLLLQSVLDSTDGDWFTLNELSTNHATLYKKMIQHQLTIDPSTPTKQAILACRHWPKGRSLFLAHLDHSSSSTGPELTVRINQEDHIGIVCVDPTGRHLGKALKTASNFVDHLDRKAGHLFCRHNDWGYLSPNPLRCGAGLRLSARVKLPHLYKKSDLMIKLQSDYKVSLKPSSEVVGDDLVAQQHSAANKSICTVELMTRIGQESIAKAVTHFRQVLLRIAIPENEVGLAEFLKTQAPLGLVSPFGTKITL